MKRFLALFLFPSFLLLSSFGFAQGAHRVSQVIVKGNGISANVGPGSKILVCVANTGCATAATIYLDSALTTRAPNPVTADGSGNYDYYVSSGCVDEQISSPGQGTQFIPQVCPFNGTGGSGGAQFPSTNAVVVNTSTVASRNATYSDIVNLFTGSGPCFLKSDGTCGSAGTSPVGTQYTIGAYNGAASGGNYQLGQSNAKTDSTGNNLSVPGALVGLQTNNAYNAYIAQTTPTSNDGIARGEGFAGANGNTFAPSNYASTELGGWAPADNTSFTDYRTGFNRWIHNGNIRGAYNNNCLTDKRLSDTAANQGYQCDESQSIFLGPGTAINNGDLFFHSAHNFYATSYTDGILAGFGGVINCYKMSDCNDYWYMTFVPGNVDGAGEGVQWLAAHAWQATNMYESTTTDVGSGLPFIITTPTSSGSGFNAGGNGQFSGGVLIDTTTTLDTGNILAETAGTPPTFGLIQTSTTHTASTVWGFSSTVVPDPGNRGTGSLESVTVTNTTGTFPTSGSFNVCFGGTANWEEDTMTAAAPSGGSQVLTGIMRYPQAVNAQVVLVSSSGLECSMIAMNANKVAGVNDPTYLILGAPDTTHYWKAYYTANDSHFDPAITNSSKALIPVGQTWNTLTRTSNVVTGPSFSGTTRQTQEMNNFAGVVISGCSDSSFNGTVTPAIYNPSTGLPIITYSSTGSNGSATGCIATLPSTLSGYKIFPAAAISTLLDPSVVGTAAYYQAPLRAVDGYFGLYANHMAVASGDVIEEPFLPNVLASAITASVEIQAPNPGVSPNNTINMTYAGGGVDSNLVGQIMIEADTPSKFVGYGGTQTRPSESRLQGVSDVDRTIYFAPFTAVDSVGCPALPTDSDYGSGTNCSSLQAYFQFQNKGANPNNGLLFTPGTNTYNLLATALYLPTTFGASLTGTSYVGVGGSAAYNAALNFFQQYSGNTVVNEIQLEDHATTTVPNLGVGTIDGLDSYYQHAAHGILDMGSTTIASTALINQLSVGVHPPVTGNWRFAGVYSGTAGSDYFSYFLSALLPNGQETPISLDQAFVNNASPIGSGFTSVTFTGTCPSPTQFGYPSGTVLKLYRTESTGNPYYYIGVCTGTVVDTGGGTIETPATVNTTAPSYAGSYTTDPLGYYGFLPNNHTTAPDTFISRGSANTIYVGNTATAHNGDIEAATFNGVALSHGGAATAYLDETGNYSVPAGGGGAYTVQWNGAVAYSVSPEYVPFPQGTAGSATTTITQYATPVSTAQTVDTLNCNLSVATAASSSATFTLVYGATSASMAATTLTCTVGASSRTCSDATHSFSIVAGGLLSMQITYTGTPGTQVQMCSVRMH